MTKKYVSIRSPKDGRSGDQWEEYFDNGEEATEYARNDWERLTRKAKTEVRVFSGVVDLNREDFLSWIDDYEGAFDSEREC